MNRLDRAIIAGLVLVVAIAAIAIGGPALTARPTQTAKPSAAATQAAYREGVLGRPTSVNPLAARTEPDRDLVALVFEGLITLDPDGDPRPALARSWDTSPDGKTWTFHLRPDARWHDGEPVTADDVVFTVTMLKDPEYRGPGAGSWNGVTATRVDDTTVRFDLDPAIAGFTSLATQAIAPAHLLGDTPAAGLADDPFGTQPVGSGPYALVEIDRDHAVLEPASAVAAPADAADATRPPSIDPLATIRASAHDEVVAVPSIDRIEMRFFDDPAALADAFRTGQVDAVSGLDPAAAGGLLDTPGSRILRDPATTLTAVALNLHPDHPEFADAKTREALLMAIDRPRLVSVAWSGYASPADTLIPPTSWAFDAKASPPVAHDLKAAAKALTDAGWKKAKDGWHLGKAADPQRIELLVPQRDANPVLAAVGAQVAADWTALGFTVTVEEVDPAVIAADRLRTGDFTAAIVQVAVGHDPDLYPLLASTQTRTGGANVFGLQDAALDDLLETARTPAPDDARKAAFSAVEKRLAEGTYVLPIAWPDRVVVLDSRVVGPAVRIVAEGSERFWDVLDWRLADDR
ncbi:MAG TPA: peptide ABC transporter substrate-binding protein [Candidatus Limnocylindrales bacterium]